MTTLNLSRERIVEAALGKVRREGSDALSLRALALELDVTAPALYDHIDSKDDLLRAIAEVGYDMLNEAFITSSPRAIERCRDRSIAYVVFAQREPELFVVMFRYRPAAIAIEVDNELPSASDAFDSGLADIQAAIDDGDLAPADPFKISMTLWASVHGVASISLLAPALASQILDDVVDNTLRGLR